MYDFNVIFICELINQPIIPIITIQNIDLL